MTQPQKFPNGLIDRLKAARSYQEIQDLLEEGEDYENAADQTRTRWRKTARKRREELEC